MKVKFTIETTYEVELPDSIAEDYSNRLDYVSANCYNLIEQGNATSISESLTKVE